MHFSREAIKGIYDTLPEQDQELVAREANKRYVNYRNDGRVHDDSLYIIQEIMIEHGYIVPFHKAVTDDGAEEYEEIMSLENLMKREAL